MEKRIKEKRSKGSVNRLHNLDPNGELLYDCSCLTICKSCLNLFGQLARSIERNNEIVSERYFQSCECWHEEKVKAGKENPPRTDTIINTVEFCNYCSKEIIPHGSKYSPLYCEDCLKFVLDFNNTTKSVSIPVGRHSFMNGIMLVCPYTKKEERQYRKEVDAFFKGIGIIKDWQRYSLFENLHDLGIDLKSDIPLSVYDRLVVKLRKDKQTKFDEMVGYMKSQSQPVYQ